MFTESWSCDQLMQKAYSVQLWSKTQQSMSPKLQSLEVCWRPNNIRGCHSGCYIFPANQSWHHLPVFIANKMNLHLKKCNEMTICTLQTSRPDLPRLLINNLPRVHRKSFFTACHLGKLRLANISQNVISTSPKNVLMSRIDFTVLP